MASKTPSAVRGTLDVLPKDSYKWQYVERVLMETASLFGFNEIRVPVFENTDLFQRSVGDTTDVVNKEMYTFDDKVVVLSPFVPKALQVQFVHSLNTDFITRHCPLRHVIFYPAIVTKNLRQVAFANSISLVWNALVLHPPLQMQR